MKIFIPSYNRSKIIKTHKLNFLKNANFHVVVHNNKQADLYMKRDIDHKRIIVSNEPIGMSYARDFIKRNLLKKDEWGCQIDDNISEVRIVRSDFYGVEDMKKTYPKYFNKNDQTFRNAVYGNVLKSQKEFESLSRETTTLCDKLNVAYAGFATTDNYFFRGRKYSHVGYVIGQFNFIKNVKDVNYDTEVSAMDDYAYTAENLKVRGGVLINKYVFPIKPHYQVGGVGTYEDRLQRKINDCKYLMKKYPGLFRYFTKKNCHPQAELIIRMHSKKQIEKWRNGLNVK